MTQANICQRVPRHARLVPPTVGAQTAKIILTMRPRIRVLPEPACLPQDTHLTRAVHLLRTVYAIVKATVPAMTRLPVLKTRYVHTIRIKNTPVPRIVQMRYVPPPAHAAAVVCVQWNHSRVIRITTRPVTHVMHVAKIQALWAATLQHVLVTRDTARMVRPTVQQQPPMDAK